MVAVRLQAMIDSFTQRVGLGTGEGPAGACRGAGLREEGRFGTVCTALDLIDLMDPREVLSVQRQAHTA